MTLPSTIKVGPAVYDVKLEKAFGGLERLWGLVTYHNTTIQIDPNDRDIFSMWSSLLHECIHIIDHIYNAHRGAGESGDLDESVVERLTTGWFQVLRNNNLFLTTTHKMPKHIDICGETYKVMFPYKAEIVDDADSHGDHGNHILYISDCNRDGIRKSDIELKYILILLIGYSIRGLFCLEDDIDSYISARLSWGLLDLFLGNDFPEKIRKLKA